MWKRRQLLIDGSLNGSIVWNVRPQLVRKCAATSARYCAKRSTSASFRLLLPSSAPDAHPLRVIQYGGELENASNAVAPRARAASSIQRWFASAFQSQIP